MGRRGSLPNMIYFVHRCCQCSLKGDLDILHFLFKVGVTVFENKIVVAANSY